MTSMPEPYWSRMRWTSSCASPSMRDAPLGARELEPGLADDLAQRALRGVLHRSVGVAEVEQVQPGVLDPPKGDEVDVDDVLVAGQHQAFPGHAAHHVGLALLAARGKAYLGAVHPRHLGPENFADRRRQIVIEARLGGADPFAEDQCNALFLGLHPVEPGGEPAEQHDDDDDQNSARAADAAGNQLADPVLALAP